jgi:hypothetical protein
MTDEALSPSRASAAANPWLVAAVVVVPTFMEVLDTTVAVVALRYIAGGLSATVDDGEWVLTSYLAANAIILPITGWLSAHLGRRNYFLISRHQPKCSSRSESSPCAASNAIASSRTTVVPTEVLTGWAKGRKEARGFTTRRYAARHKLRAATGTAQSLAIPAAVPSTSSSDFLK